MKKMNKKGFTLVEMLVVIAIIAILVSILVPTVLGATNKAKAATDAANLRSELASFQIEYLTNDGSVTGYTQQTGNLAIYIKNATSTCKSDSTLNRIAIYVPTNGDADAMFTSATTLTVWPTTDIKNIAYFAGKAGGSN